MSTSIWKQRQSRIFQTAMAEADAYREPSVYSVIAELSDEVLLKPLLRDGRTLPKDPYWRDRIVAWNRHLLLESARRQDEQHAAKKKRAGAPERNLHELIFLHEGRVLARGTAEALDHSDHALVREFMGSTGSG